MKCIDSPCLLLLPCSTGPRGYDAFAAWRDGPSGTQRDVIFALGSFEPERGGDPARDHIDPLGDTVIPPRVAVTPRG